MTLVKSTSIQNETQSLSIICYSPSFYAHINGFLAQMCKEAQLQGRFTNHGLRRKALSLLCRGDMNTLVVAKMANKSVSGLEDYVEASKDDMERKQRILSAALLGFRQCGGKGREGKAGREGKGDAGKESFPSR